jgi:hypothetical protein
MVKKKKPKTIKIWVPDFTEPHIMFGFLFAAGILIFIALFLNYTGSDVRIDEPRQEYNYDKVPEKNQYNNFLDIFGTAFENKFFLFLFFGILFWIFVGKTFFRRRGLF